MEGFVGIYALLLIPGFIWVQVYEHYLLREKKEQFVKTLEIVLWSALIWAISLYLSVNSGMLLWLSKKSVLSTILPIDGGRVIVKSIIETAKGKNGFEQLATSPIDIVNFFGAVCLWSFLGANLWSLARRNRWGNLMVMGLTGRDWYPTASQRFYAENMGRVVCVITKEREYYGILCSAPDTGDDGHIILANINFLPRPSIPNIKPEKLRAVNSLLIKLSDVLEMRSIQCKVTPGGPWVNLKKSWASKFRRTNRNQNSLNS